MKKYIYIFTLNLIFGCSINPPGKALYTGQDLNNKTKTCEEMKKNTRCTRMYTPSDRYSSECKQSGYKAVQCGCHDWICIKK